LQLFLTFAPQNLGNSEQVFLHVVKYAIAERQAASEWTIRKPGMFLRDKAKFYHQPYPNDYQIKPPPRYFGFMLDPQMSVSSEFRLNIVEPRAELAYYHKSAEGVFSDYVRALHSFSSERIIPKALDHSIDTILVVPSTWSDEARTIASKVRLHSFKVTT
jgi:hypothetical protein